MTLHIETPRPAPPPFRERRGIPAAPPIRLAHIVSVSGSHAVAILERQDAVASDDARVQIGAHAFDGRDIGTVIAPEADVKLFVTASPEVRAERRLRELEARGMCAGYEDVLADIRARDRRDSTRDVAPLMPAIDAILLDTSALDVGQAIADALRLTHERLAGAT